MTHVTTVVYALRRIVWLKPNLLVIAVGTKVTSIILVADRTTRFYFNILALTKVEQKYDHAT